MKSILKQWGDELMRAVVISLLMMFVSGISAPVSVRAQRSTVLVAGVADAETGRPLEGAEIVLYDLRRIVRADWLGEVAVADVPVGRHRVRVRRIGYAAADVDMWFMGDTTGPVFMLEPTPPLLDTVRINASWVRPKLRDFESRRRTAAGRYMTEPELAAEGNHDFEIVAVTHFPGLQIETDVDGVRRLVSTRGVERGCPVKIFLDDADLTEFGFDVVRTWDLSAAEYYTGASMPMRYRVAGSACGVLVLWSK